jgi:xanthine dehydrogenase molybdopterin-binding subunit B
VHIFQSSILLDNLDIATEAALKVKISYSKQTHPLVLDIEEAVKQNYAHQMNFAQVTRGDSCQGFKQAGLIVVEGQVKVNGQYHFYLENQVYFGYIFSGTYV